MNSYLKGEIILEKKDNIRWLYASDVTIMYSVCGRPFFS